LIHGSILQGFHHNNNGKRHEAVHLIPRNWPVAAPVAWRRPAQESSAKIYYRARSNNHAH
jgi:hypothetical protein